MNFGRFKDFNWDKARARRRGRLKVNCDLPQCPDFLIVMTAWHYIAACYKSPWRALRVMLVWELRSVWLHYGWPKWEWTRVNVFRLRPDQDIAEFNRFMEEQDAIEELCGQL